MRFDNVTAHEQVRVILDPVSPVAPSAVENFEYPMEYFSVDVLIPNLAEAAELADESGGGLRTAKLVGSDLVARGVNCVVIKMGKRGCFIVDRERAVHIPAFEVEMVDRANCGNAFAGALAASCAVGDDIKDAVRFASAAGALACTKFGEQEALPTKQEIIELLQKQED